MISESWVTAMAAAVEVEPDRIRFRPALDREVDVRLEHAVAEDLAAGSPWRTFRWYHGQRHYSGTYWCATEATHLIYESRLELARLVYADFDPAVHRMAAQPFLMSAVVAGVKRRHVPDFLLLTDAGPVVVDVKRKAALDRPAVAGTLAWAGEMVAQKGWGYEVWTEPEPAERQNIVFLAGYRRRALFNTNLLESIKNAGLDNLTVREAIGTITGYPEPLARSALLHLIWSRYFDTDLSAALTPANRLSPGPCR